MNLKKLLLHITALIAVFTVQANNSKNEISNIEVKWSGVVKERITHENTSCMFITTKHSKNNFMACQSTPLNIKSIKGKFITITGNIVAINSVRENSKSKPFPIVEIENIEIKKPNYYYTNNSHSPKMSFYDPSYFTSIGR